MDLYWIPTLLSVCLSVLCCRRCWMTRHRSEPLCRASAQSWRKCHRFATSQLSRNNWSKRITKWPPFKTASLLLCLNWSTLLPWVLDFILFLFFLNHLWTLQTDRDIIYCVSVLLVSPYREICCSSLCSCTFLFWFCLFFCKYWSISRFLGGGSHWEWSQADGEWRGWDQDFIIVSRDFPQPQRRKPQGETWQSIEASFSSWFDCIRKDYNHEWNWSRDCQLLSQSARCFYGSNHKFKVIEVFFRIKKTRFWTAPQKNICFVFLNALLMCAGCWAEDPVHEEDYSWDPEV